ncbi:alpha-glucuronidase [Neisseria sp. HSC-16F19]|nr:CII family transcriptional regulator [Neisseria sp. HSC-16F19]MCP2041892.1 alpha-glucuronidase [Neisseria sp. HSC-16F19]
MTELSAALYESARKNERAILHALARVTARHVCDVSGLSESQLSRMKEERLEQYCTALAAMGLKVVPADAVTVSKAEKKFMAEKMIEHYQAILEAED